MNLFSAADIQISQDKITGAMHATHKHQGNLVEWSMPFVTRTEIYMVALDALANAACEHDRIERKKTLQ